MMVKTTLLAAALLVLSPLGLCAPAPSPALARAPVAPLARRQYDNGTVSLQSDQSMPSKYGETCIGWTNKNTAGEIQVSVQCSYIPEGLGLSVYIAMYPFPLVNLFWDNDVHTSEWKKIEGDGIYIEPMLWYVLREDSSSLSDCTVKRNKDEKSWYQRNEFEAEATCSYMAPFAKVRAYLDMYLQIDEHSSWMEGPVSSSTTVKTGYHRPTDPRVDPTAKLEWAFKY